MPAAAILVHGWFAPSPGRCSGAARLTRRAETVRGFTSTLPCRGRRTRIAAAALSGDAGTVGTAGGSAATVLDRRLGRGDGSRNHVAPTIESTVESVIFDFRFLALLAIAGSLAGSLLCFHSGCVYIKEAYHVYWTSCVRGVHTGQMVLRLVEAIDVYLAGTVMLIFGMGLYGLFISNDLPEEPSSDRALKRSSLFGMFTLKERPRWMRISSLDELKTKLGHVIVMILLVKMFERSKMMHIATAPPGWTSSAMHSASSSLRRRSTSYTGQSTSKTKSCWCCG